MGKEAQGAKLKESGSDELSAVGIQPSAQAKGVPIIAMTAHAMAGDREKCLEVGMNDHVAKPINTNQLFVTLTKWIHFECDRQTNHWVDSGYSPKSDKMFAGETNHQASGKTAQDGMPESLPGFDISDGLKRLQGNRHLYQKLLMDFASRYQMVGKDIMKALADRQMRLVHDLVHNLKGLAGNLSAVRLLAAATHMDTAVKKALSDNNWHSDQMNSLSMELQESLSQALKSCTTLKSSAPIEIAESATDSIPSMPTELAKKTAEDIFEALELGNVHQLKTIAETFIAPTAEFTGLGKKMRQLTDDFDFDGIVILARQLEKQAKIKD